MSFGTKFRILREQKGMPRASCDELFNLMRGTVSNWENGFAEPEEDLLPDIVSNWENGFAEPEEDLLPDIAGFFGIRLSELMSDAPLVC